MVGQEAVFIAGAFTVLIFVISLSRFDDESGAGRAWAASWCCLYLSGAAAAISDRWIVVQPLYPILGTSFALLLVQGALRFLREPEPRWLVPLFVAVAASRVVVQPFASELWFQSSASVAIVAGCVISSAIALKGSEARAPGRRTLVAALALIAGASLTYSTLHAWPEQIGTARFAWLIAGTVGAGMQTLALQERVATRADAERSVLLSLLEAIPMGLAFGDRSGRISMMNQGFAKQIGDVERHAWTGTRMDAISEQLGLESEGGLEADAAVPSELRMADGRILVSHLHPVEARDGGALGHLWFLNDVTAERGVHDRLERARRLELIADLAGGVAHDFNNHLTTVMGNAALIRESIHPNGQWEGPLDDLEAAAARCAERTRDLLDFSHRGHRLPTAIDLSVRLPELASRLRAALPSGQRLVVSVDATTPPILADRRQLERVLENLLTNASHAIAGSGTIEFIAAPRPYETVRLTVRDDGAGMSADVQERAFDPFFSTKGSDQGTGLGLAIVHGIASGHGAELQIESAPGRGCAVHLDWPVAPDEGARPALSRFDA